MDKSASARSPYRGNERLLIRRLLIGLVKDNNKEMENIKVGDWVLIKSNRFTDHLTRVTKVTSKQFVTTKGSRFLKKNGRLIGSGEWDTVYACIPSQCDVDRLLERQQKHELITKLSEYLKTKDIPIETLQSWVETIEAIEN
jgi:hypothetical protein